MSVLIAVFLLCLAIKKLVNGGLFIDTIKKMDEEQEKVKNGEEAKIEGDTICWLLGAVILVCLNAYMFCLGAMTPGLFMPTVVMFGWAIYKIMYKRERVGKYTIGSIAEDLMGVVYYAYFLYVLI